MATDVFFRGYGKWLYGDESCDGGHVYKASGVFRLTEQDEIAYEHIKILPHVETLLPSDHQGSELLKIAEQPELYVNDLRLALRLALSPEDAKNCYFRVTQYEPANLVVVKSDEPAELVAITGMETPQLEPLTNEQRLIYNRKAAWTWIEALYILQGYEPQFQLNTDFVRGHFPAMVGYFTQSIQLGDIAKEITQLGEKTFIDSPAKWEAFWQGINKPEPQTKPVGDAGAGSQVTESLIKARQGGYFERDEAAIKLVKDNPGLLSMRPASVKRELQRKNPAFTQGYNTWWRGQEIFPKGKPGTNKKSN